MTPVTGAFTGGLAILAVQDLPGVNHGRFLLAIAADAFGQFVEFVAWQVRE